MDNPFNYGRTTGLKSGILGIPTVATAVNASDALREGVADILQSDKKMTEEDAMRIGRLVPLNNAFGIANAMRALAGALPEDEPYDPRDRQD
ncbi:MAG: hypothetical protein A2882_01355 [Phenylobacterium sp. RIFCSPHIGHO2_01_FULL_70_10]|nr:MAG: hypothetical protein A2882_01355 [Phenylobacterium sp. RIFCSPHIGHO2_01_FULL_70_10]